MDVLDGTQLENGVKRVIVLGASGFFGGAAMGELGYLGITAIPASRHEKNGLAIDVDNPQSIRRQLRRGDLVLDTAGPFRGRSTALIDAAIDIGFDLIDINEDLAYAKHVMARKTAINAAGIRVLSSASTVSAIAAAMVRYADIAEPTGITAVLAPALRKTANRGVALSMIRSLGQPIQIWNQGDLQTVHGRSTRTFAMPSPIGTIHARRFESADSVLLPTIWPTLQNVEMYVAARTPMMNLMLGLASRSALLRRQFERFIDLGIWLARRLGPSAGGIAYEIESGDGQMSRVTIMANDNSFLTAVTPAVLAAKAIVEGRFPTSGLVMPDHYVDPRELVEYLRSREIEVRYST